jgi:hypothetical protein
MLSQAEASRSVLSELDSSSSFLVYEYFTQDARGSSAWELMPETKQKYSPVMEWQISLQGGNNYARFYKV